MGIIRDIREMKRLAELERKRKHEANRQEAMDRITLEWCEHLYQVLGWRADIRAGHLVALGKLAGKNMGARR